jgi:type II secretory pathway pseudopilin PulG
VKNTLHGCVTKLNQSEKGLSLLEILASLAVLMIVSGAVVGAIIGMTQVQSRLSIRTGMHSSVRSATELLEQEIGQAGKNSMPGIVTLAAPVAIGSNIVTVNSTVPGNSTSGMFAGDQVVIDTGANQETVTLTGVNNTQISAIFSNTHLSNASVAAAGGFSSGVVPPSMVNGSTGNLLKIYGDINGDGNMVYVEYKCDPASGNLYRNSMAYDTASASKPALSSGLVLLPNILANPGGAACFTYQTKTVNGSDYIVNVAVTLTVQTQTVDIQTGQSQQETKALLNVSPRNVFEVWELASLGITNRIQPMPASVTSLLP